MRFICLLFFFITLNFAKVLSLDEAFKLNTYSDDKAIFLELKIADEIYLYDDKIKILLNNQDLSPLINHQEPVLKQNERVH